MPHARVHFLIRRTTLACLGSKRANGKWINVGERLVVDGFWYTCERQPSGSIVYAEGMICFEAGWQGPGQRNSPAVIAHSRTEILGILLWGRALGLAWTMQLFRAFLRVLRRQAIARR